jgi:hypothetical protein
VVYFADLMTLANPTSRLTDVDWIASASYPVRSHRCQESLSPRGRSARPLSSLVAQFSIAELEDALQASQILGKVGRAIPMRWHCKPQEPLHRPGHFQHLE